MTTELREVIEVCVEAMRLASTSHRVMLLSHPPQSAWDTYQVSEALRAATAIAEEALKRPEPRNQCGETCERARLCAACAQAIESPAQTPCSIAEDGVCEVLDCCGKPPQRAPAQQEREPGGVCGQCGGWVCDPVVRPGHITVGMPPCEVVRSEPRRLTDDEIGRIWFQAKIPGLTETNARLLIRAAERFVRGEQGVADPVVTR